MFACVTLQESACKPGQVRVTLSEVVTEGCSEWLISRAVNLIIASLDC